MPLDSAATSLVPWLALLLFVVVFLVFYRYTFRIFGIVVVPEDAVGIVNKQWKIFGDDKSLPDGRLIALRGEAGIQADTLAPGIKFGYWPWQYSVELRPFITIPDGSIGVVEARDGTPLSAGRVLARAVPCDMFQNARAFLENSGERGPQIAVMPPGTYRINTALFSIARAEATVISDNMVGIVTTQEGAPLPSGEIAGEEVKGHNSFQDGQAFIDAGGTKGLQEQVILAGRYYINPRFATVSEQKMTTVPIAHVGVVVSYVGKSGTDLSGEAFKQGNLVGPGEKGVCNEPLDPGKYAINPFTHSVELVPTANVVLNWADAKNEAHNLDANLSTIGVRSADGFKFNIDVSQIIHIPRQAAPKVIARFGNMSNLVTQVLEPTIGNYFRNAAQGSDVISFLNQRQPRQDAARSAIAAALDQYDVGAVDTLIGDISPPMDLMKTLTDRKIAEQQKLTFETEQQAQAARKDLEQSKALADTQARVVDAERTVTIESYKAEATVKEAEGALKKRKLAAEGEAAAKALNADADATVLKKVGDAEAAKILAVGKAEAQVVKEKTMAVGAENFALIEIGRTLAENKIKLVPELLVNGAGGAAGGSGGGSLVDVLLGQLVLKQREPSAPRAGSDTVA